MGVEVRVRRLEGAGTMEGQRGSVAYWDGSGGFHV